jgi:NAD(P)-dependent dehydrogenase (short-subunit alcohol dehydrogenase family)
VPVNYQYEFDRAVIPGTGLPAYVAAKAAIIGLTRTTAHELGGAGIFVNSVLPGAILTELQRRLWWTPEYQAELRGQPCLKKAANARTCRMAHHVSRFRRQCCDYHQAYLIDGGCV